MTYQRLTSVDNPLLKMIRRAAAGSGRASRQMIAAEGIRVLEEGTASVCEIEAAVISEQFGADPREKTLLEAWESKGIRICVVNDALFKSISAVQTHQGAVALFNVPERTIADALPENGSLIPLMLIADRIRDPGNLGVLIRTAAAAGASAVVTLAGSVSARNSKAVRSSAGAFFRVPVIEHVAAGKLLDFCRSRSIRLYRADARGGIRYTEADLRTSCAVLLGSETGGISEKDFAGVTSITVPMAHDAESLNVAMAGSVIFFEAFRQRHHLRQPCLL